MGVGSSLTGRNIAGETPHAFSSSASHASFAGLKRPVPVAMPIAQFAPPPSVCWSHSAGDSHCFTAANFRGCVRRSQRSFAGQNDARCMQPVRACVVFSVNSARSAAASSRQRASAQVMMFVSAVPFASHPTRLCQKHDTPSPSMRRPRSAGSVRWRWSVCSRQRSTALSSAPGSISAAPSAEVRSG